MRVSREDADKNRRRVIAVAGEQFRAHGFDGIGIADLMKQAGLTHGGFYKQFASKADLEAEASAAVLRENAELWDRVIAKRKDDPLGALLSFYLSDKRLDQVQEACGMATLAGDAARHAPDVRSAFTSGILRHVEQISDIVPGKNDGEKRGHAMAVLAGMAGALVLARAVDDRRLANELMDTVRKDLANRFGG
jgi:TetR/AcrR family transcriptional repressor of nem operon